MIPPNYVDLPCLRGRFNLVTLVTPGTLNTLAPRHISIFLERHLASKTNRDISTYKQECIRHSKQVGHTIIQTVRMQHMRTMHENTFSEEATGGASVSDCYQLWRVTCRRHFLESCWPQHKDFLSITSPRCGLRAPSLEMWFDNNCTNQLQVHIILLPKKNPHTQRAQNQQRIDLCSQTRYKWFLNAVLPWIKCCSKFL